MTSIICWPVGYAECQEALEAAEDGDPVTLLPHPDKPGALIVHDRAGRPIGLIAKTQRLAKKIVAGAVIQRATIHTIGDDGDERRAGLDVKLAGESAPEHGRT